VDAPLSCRCCRMALSKGATRDWQLRRFATMLLRATMLCTHLRASSDRDSETRLCVHTGPIRAPKNVVTKSTGVWLGYIKCNEMGQSSREAAYQSSSAQDVHSSSSSTASGSPPTSSADTSKAEVDPFETQ
jgi:hypothetical protein